MIDNTNNKFKKVVLASAIGMALGLSGCGGGGGSAAVPVENATGATIDGAASKGIIKNGVVTAEELSAAGEVIATVGSAVTGDNGSYSLTLDDNYQGGPIQISITADGDTQTKCDVPAGCGTRTDGLSDTDSNIDFGEWYKPAALNMIALVPDAEANETLSVSVTPFTHMAAARAKESGTLDAAAISNANSEVSNLLGGIDILNTLPVDITDSAAVNDAQNKTQVTYAALASALSNQGLVDANGQPDLNAAIELLASSFTSGVIEADDSDGDDAAQISLQEIIDAADATFTEAGISDVTGVLSELQVDIDIAEAGDGTINPEPGETADDPNLDKVKAMMSDVRTWGNVIATETEASRTAFEAQVGLAADAFGALGLSNPVDALDASIDAAFAFINGAGSTAIADYDLGLNSFANGTIDSSVPGVIVITDGRIHGYTVNMTINLPEDGLYNSNLIVGIASGTIDSNSSKNSMTINSGLVDMTLATAYTVDHAAIDAGLATDPDVTSLTVDLDVSLTQNVDSSGVALDSPVTFDGVLDTNLVKVPVTNNPDDVAVLPKTLTMTGLISNTAGDSVSAELAVNITNASAITFVGDVLPAGTLYTAMHGEPMIQWGYSDTDGVVGNDTFAYTTTYQNVSLYWTVDNTYSTNIYSYTNFYYGSLIELVQNQVYLYDDYLYEAGEGSYAFYSSGADLTVDGAIDGVLDYSEDESTYPVGTLYSANHSTVYFWEYSDTDAVPGDDTFTLTRPSGESLSYYWNVADNSITATDTYQIGQYVSLSDAITNSGYIYPYDVSIWVEGEGNYYASIAGADFSVGGEVPGILTEPEYTYIDETDVLNGWIDADIGLTFSAQFNGLPEASVNIVADRTGFEAGDGQVTISYGDRQLSLSASLSGSVLDGTVTITNQDNVVLSFEDTDIDVDGSSLSGTLSYNGVVYGTVTETADGLLKTTYTDGTFEIF